MHEFGGWVSTPLHTNRLTDAILCAAAPARIHAARVERGWTGRHALAGQVRWGAGTGREISPATKEQQYGKHRQDHWRRLEQRPRPASADSTGRRGAHGAAACTRDGSQAQRVALQAAAGPGRAAAGGVDAGRARLRLHARVDAHVLLAPQQGGAAGVRRRRAPLLRRADLRRRPAALGARPVPRAAARRGRHADRAFQRVRGRDRGGAARDAAAPPFLARVRPRVVRDGRRDSMVKVASWRGHTWPPRAHHRLHRKARGCSQHS